MCGLMGPLCLRTVAGPWRQECKKSKMRRKWTLSHSYICIGYWQPYNLSELIGLEDLLRIGLWSSEGQLQQRFDEQMQIELEVVMQQDKRFILWQTFEAWPNHGINCLSCPFALFTCIFVLYIWNMHLWSEGAYWTWLIHCTNLL
jgi:hypothetical protein